MNKGFASSVSTELPEIALGGVVIQTTTPKRDLTNLTANKMKLKRLLNYWQIIRTLKSPVRKKIELELKKCEARCLELTKENELSRTRTTKGLNRRKITKR